MPKRRKYGTKRPYRPRVPPCRTNPCPLCLRRKHGSLPGRIGRSSARGKRSGRGGLWKTTRPRRKCTDTPNPPYKRSRPQLRRRSRPIHRRCVGNPSYRVSGRKYPNLRLWNPLHGGHLHTFLPRRKSLSPCRKRNGLPIARCARPTTGWKRRLRNPLQRQRRHERPDSPRRMGSQDRCSMLSIRRPNRSRC